MSAVIELLRDLVAFPSLSGEEGAVSDFLREWLAARDLAAQVLDHNLAVRVGDSGPTLLLNSHLDVVGVGTGWETEPFTPVVRDGRMIGRGCNDAKASVAAMAVAMAALRQDPPPGVQILFAATTEEERGPNGLRRFLPHLGPLHSAVVGEPTELHPAVVQNGLLLLELTARGRAGHAARPHLAVNAIDIAVKDIAALHALTWEPTNPHVGAMTLVVTQVSAGRAHNVIPDTAEMVIDARTIPELSPEAVIERVRSVVQSEVHVRSNRLRPVATPPDAPILAAVLAALPEAKPFGSPTVSDWSQMPDVPAVKLGPGRSEVSHTANEWVELDQVERAAVAYERIAREWAARVAG